MKKKKLSASKLFVDLSFLLSYGFIIYCCYEMHRLNDLSPIAYIGAGVLVLLGIVVKAYMARAAAEDLSKIKMYETAKLSQLKEKYGDNYQEGHVEQPDLNV